MHFDTSTFQTDDEKRHMEAARYNIVSQETAVVSCASPPSYETTIHTLPPPTYLQSTARLQYKYQPYITEYDELTFRQEQERQQDNDQGDTWSEMLELPLRRRINYYITSWRTTINDGRLVFFTFFVLASFAVMTIIIAIIIIPNLLIKP